MLNQDTQTAIQFGKKLRETRHFFDYTQTDLAKRIGISTSSVCKIEKGRKPITKEILTKINQTYGTRLKYPKAFTPDESFAKTKANFIAFLEQTLESIRSM